MYQAGRPPGVSLAPYRGAAAWACAHTPLLCAPLQAAERALAESPLNICGILLGLAGSVTYSAVSYIESSTAAARNAKVGAAGGWQGGHSL